jgi:hypothetical protein
MTYTQLGMDSVFVLIFIVPVMIWQAAASRPMETIEITHRFNDMARMLFIGPVCTILVQGIAITIAVLSDKSERPVLPRWLRWFNLWAPFPRWFGYYTAWTALMFEAGAVAFLTRSGPFAWNGLLAFRAPVVTFFAWIVVIATLLFRATGLRDHKRPRGARAANEAADFARASVPKS